MPQVSIHTPAPDFALANFHGEVVQPSDFKGISNILLVFNRGFL